MSPVSLFIILECLKVLTFLPYLLLCMCKASVSESFCNSLFLDRQRKDIVRLFVKFGVEPKERHVKTRATINCQSTIHSLILGNGPSSHVKWPQFWTKFSDEICLESKAWSGPSSHTYVLLYYMRKKMFYKWLCYAPNLSLYLSIIFIIFN